MARFAPTLLLAAAMLLVPAVRADDPDPPVFKGISLEPGPYGPGDEVPMQLRWEDASGIDQVYASAIGPAELRVHNVQCEDPADDRVAVVDCKLRLPARAPGGTYSINYVQAQDVVGHYAYATTDATFTVESPYNDRSGPVLTSLVQNLTQIDMASVASQWGHVRIGEAFFLEATDDSNLTYANLNFAGPNGNQGMWVQCDRAFGSAGELDCTLWADPEIPAGAYVLRAVNIQDEIGYTTYYHYGGWYGGSTRDLSPVAATPPSIQVVSNHTDDKAPVLVGLTFPGRLHRGQPFEVRINATDATAVEQVSVFFRTTRGNAGYYVSTYAACEGEKDGDAQLVCTGRFPDNFPLGLALVDWVNVVDQGQNWGWLRPVEVGNAWGPPETQFRDDDAHDVGTILVPRPIEGVLEAVDAVVNEVMPGEVATIVYHAEDTVDDVELVLQDAVDGSQVTVDCGDAVETLLGQECDFTVPSTEAGVLSLVSASAVTETGQQTTTYEAGEVPLLAVSREIPKAQEMPLALGGGALNTVGHDWHAEFEKAKQLAAQGSDAGPTSAPPEPAQGAGGGSGTATMTVTGEPAPLPPEPAPTYAVAERTHTATPRVEDEATDEPVANEPPIRFEPVDDGATEQQDAPLPLAVALGALAIALRRRRA